MAAAPELVSAGSNLGNDAIGWARETNSWRVRSGGVVLSGGRSVDPDSSFRYSPS